MNEIYDIMELQLEIMKTPNYITLYISFDRLYRNIH